MVKVGRLHYGQPLSAWEYKADRSTPLGNPFYMGHESMRDEVCDEYEAYFMDFVARLETPEAYDLSDKDIEMSKQLEHLLELAKQVDITLMCWCYPKRCHCDTIAAWLNKQLELVNSVNKKG